MTPKQREEAAIARIMWAHSDHWTITPEERKKAAAEIRRYMKGREQKRRIAEHNKRIEEEHMKRQKRRRKGE